MMMQSRLPASRQSYLILSWHLHRSNWQRVLSISAVAAALVVSDLSPWELRAVTVGDHLPEGWCLSPVAWQAEDGVA